MLKKDLHDLIIENNLRSVGISDEPIECEHQFLKLNFKTKEWVCTDCKKLIKESKQMETKIHKWQIDDGNVVEYDFNSDFGIGYTLHTLYPKLYYSYYPGDFTPAIKEFHIFMKDGTVKHAKYIKPEPKIGDVVNTPKGFGIVDKIDLNGDFWCKTEYDYFSCNRNAYKNNLISSFEDWCKNNLPRGLRINNAIKEWDLLDNGHNLYACINKSWSLIDQIKVTQAIIEAVKGDKNAN